MLGLSGSEGGDPGSEGRPSQPLGRRSFGWRVFEMFSIGLAVLVAATVLWLAIDVILLLFAAVLLAAVLRAPTEALARYTGLPDQGALAVVVFLLLALLAGVGSVLAPQVAAQVPQLVDSLADALTQLHRSIGLDELTEDMADDIDLQSVLPSPQGLIGGATGLVTSTFGMFANLVILFVVGVYLAANPSLYIDGATRLVPAAKRHRVRETLQALGRTLRWWMIGQLVTMSAVGVLSYVGLTLLGVPLALVLAVIAFLLTFIPFLGPILSTIPVVLVASTQGLETTLYALALYGLIQSFEGYVLTPLVQRRAVALPPALTVSAQVLLGVLVGGLGIALATPFAAAAMVAVRMLYVEDVLGERVAASAPG